MAAIPLGNIQLIDRWPGPVNPNLGIPTGGWDGTTHSCVTTAVYQIGTKVMAYSDATPNPGWYTMMYARIAGYSAGTLVGSDGPEQDISDGKMWCFHSELTEDANDNTYSNLNITDGSHSPRFLLSGCTTSAITDCTLGGPAALACATYNGYECGWFWVGGVCPVADVTIFQGDSGDATQEAAGADMTVLVTTNSTGLLWMDCTDSGEVMLVGELTLVNPLSQTLDASDNAYGIIGYVDQS